MGLFDVFLAISALIAKMHFYHCPRKNLVSVSLVRIRFENVNYG